MKLAAPLVKLFDHPVDDLLAALPPADDSVWDYFSRRQKFPMHAATRTIAFAWSEHWEEEGDPVVFLLDYAPAALRAAAEAYAERLAGEFGGGTVTRLVLVELPAGAKVKRHRDVDPLITLAHRCHVPVETNGDVSFVIGATDHFLAAGHAYEFDNTRPHSVANRGATRRVHLICDILPPADQRGA